MTNPHPLTDEMRIEYLRPDYQAAYSQLARKFTILHRIVKPSVLNDAEVNCIIIEAMKLIEAVEKSELTLQIISEEEQ